MQHRIPGRSLAGVDDLERADASGVAGLAAAHGIEHGAIELDALRMHGDDRRLARLQISIFTKKQLGHQPLIQPKNASSATAVTTSPPAAKKRSVVSEASGRSGSRGTGSTWCSSCSAVLPGAGGACRAPTFSLKLRKKSSATFFAAASTRREPICASLPPTLAFTSYASKVWSFCEDNLTCAPPLANPAGPPWPSKVMA